MQNEKIKIGISWCLLGEKVRYDGNHKLDKFLVYTLGKYVDYVHVCPEVECGLGVPRKPMRLVGDPNNPKLIITDTQKDVTEQMSKWIKIKIEALKKEDICAFIFKNKSPSCGLKSIKIYDNHGRPHNKGFGIFAKAIIEAFPHIPVEEAERLNNPQIRESFIEQIFILKRWREIYKHKSIKKLIQFHSTHKFIFMSHSNVYLKRLGQIVAQHTNNKSIKEIFNDYEINMLECLKYPTTTKKHTNVLMHIMGFFKNNLQKQDKQELLTVIDSYYNNHIPLIVPITLIKFLAKKYNITYINDQYYLNPHPLELQLRNHV